MRTSYAAALLLALAARPALSQPKEGISQQAPPQLGRAPLPAVVAALTPAEKVQLVVGMGFRLPGAPANLLPPGNPGNPGDADVPDKVPGAAGRTHAVPRLGIPSLTLSDGPAGVRIDSVRAATPGRTYYATAFPQATALASTWDTALVRRVGRAFGSEVRDYGIDVLLAPGMNLHRNPLGGRNFEYYSEDPLLTGSVAAALVQGVQANGVGTSVKHFAANEQEFNRQGLNEHISERALRELYLKGFELVVQQARPWTIMSSYNLINGTYTSESPDLLTALLRQEWGYRGLVMSDWYGGKNPVAQLHAGNDLLMPGTAAQTQTLLAALKSGQLSPADLDRDVTRVLELVLKSPTFKGLKYSGQPALAADGQVARQAAAAGMVLLRNERQTLPLPAGRRVALFGNGSYRFIAGGTGSGDVNRAYTISLDRGLREAGFAVEAGLLQSYQQYLRTELAKLPKKGFFDPVPMVPELPLDDARLAQLAQATDVAVLTLARSAGEGGDRKVADDFDLSAAEHTQLQRVAAAFHAQGKPLVVVLNVGGALETASWRELADALVLAWQPGQEAGRAVADVLGGQANPSGKLPATWPRRYQDVPYAQDFPGKLLPGATADASGMRGAPSETTYQEGVYVGYRYFTTFGVKPAYEFGYGLSYTSFGYGPLTLSSATLGTRLTASLTVTNTGRVPGQEVVQLYVQAPTGSPALDKPTQELRAFAKTTLLAPGQSQQLTFALTPADVASFYTATSSWQAAAGTYTVLAGASALDIRQRATFQLPQAITTARSRPLLRPQQPVAELKPGQRP